MSEPRRGEVWMVDLGMAAKVRPCLVMSIGATEQDRALATLVPHTTSARNSRFEVSFKINFLREGVFDPQFGDNSTREAHPQDRNSSGHAAC